jgi:hypothetical protein
MYVWLWVLTDFCKQGTIIWALRRKFTSLKCNENYVANFAIIFTLNNKKFPMVVQQPHNFFGTTSSHDNRGRTLCLSLKSFLLANHRLFPNVTYNLFFKLSVHFILSKASIKLASVVITSRSDLRAIEKNEPYFCMFSWIHNRCRNFPFCFSHKLSTFRWTVAESHNSSWRVTDKRCATSKMFVLL